MLRSDHNSKMKKAGHQSVLSGALLSVLVFFFGASQASAQAIPIPNTPMQIGNNVPPNIMMILDTSGSMEFPFLNNPGVDVSGGDLDMDDLSFTYVYSGSESYRVAPIYTRNRVYYNPNITYQTWRLGDGSYLPERPYNSVWASPELVSGTTANLSSSVQTFYVPKNGATDLNDLTQYYRFQFLTDGRVVRSERLEAGESTTEVLLNVTNLAADRNRWVGGGTGANAPNNIFVDVPDNVTNLRVRTISNDIDANLYVRSGSAPTTGTYSCRSNNNNNSNETCSINNPAEGRWYIGVRAANDNGDGFTGLRLIAEITTADPNTGENDVGCSTAATGWGWRNCTITTPTGRSASDELQNYANWYSFHRTRMKSAKAGISYGFSDLGEEFRVGFASLSSLTRRIPVSTDGGLFRDRSNPSSSNRSDWFNTLFTAGASGGTPLRSALARVGEYYKESGNTGPYAGTGASQLACRQNFSILTTDGYWNGDSSYDNSSSVDGDEDTGSAITGPNNASYTYSPARPYRADQQGTLADVAMQYWKNDLRAGTGGLENIVPSSTSNPAFWQHMVTFGISLGLKGNLNPDSDLPGLTSGAKTWGTPTPNSESPANIDDLWHASLNSRGSFVAATDPDEFSAAIRSALATVVERTASSSNVATNSTALSTDTRLFQARYVSGRWVGELLSYQVTKDGVAALPVWSASQKIPNPASRTILTWNGSGGSEFPTSAQSTALNNPVAGVSDYIRGDRSLELGKPGGTFRPRLHVLGDIVNSSPVFVADTNTVYVGANDGMLHAFDAATGVEQFGYVPGNIDLALLRSYSNQNYAHAYFVDGSISVSTRSQTPNKNYLVGALGRGGKGVFGLDVTNPDAINESDILWDFDASNHDLMGNVLGRPIIAKLNNGDVGVIVANGPNSANNTAVLYVLDITDGSVIAEINTGSGSAAAPNGLSTPRGWDDNGDGTLDYVYAGDLLGNLWKFNLSASNKNQWTNAANRQVMFRARDAGGNFQPITGSPTIGLDPKTYNRWVFFGTGRLLNSSDLTESNGDPNVDVQTWYGLIDSGVAIANRSELQKRGIVAATSINGNPVRAFEASEPLDVTKVGWYIDLLTPPLPGTAEGERMIGDSALIGTTLIAPSIIPNSAACGSGGRGFVNAINAFTGSSVSPIFFDVTGDGIFDQEDTIEVDGVRIPIGSVDLGVAMPTTPTIVENLLIAGGSDGSTGQLGVNNPAGAGRVSWREVVAD